MIDTASCSACKNGIDLPFSFTMAFQPIVDLARRRVWGYEALVRGPEGQSADWVLSQVTDENRYAFDQSCRVKAIELAAGLFQKDGSEILSINFMPKAVYVPATCIRTTIQAAERTGFPLHRIMFEFIEDEEFGDTSHIKAILADYSKRGLKTALDDFGAGYSGLALLTEFQTDFIKIDKALTRALDQSPARQAIVRGVTTMAKMLDITLIAEGIETVAEMRTIDAMGIRLQQGYLFARPELEVLPDVTWPRTDSLSPGEAAA